MRHRTTGRIWQGRFKAFPIQRDSHLLTVIRYVERNPLRAGLVDTATAWAWSSLRPRLEGAGGDLLDPSPVPLPTIWKEWVEEPLTSVELEALQASGQRERPFGDAAWMRGTAERMGLTATLQPRGRPRAFGAARNDKASRPS